MIHSYIDKKSGRYPVHLGDIALEHPSVPFEQLAALPDYIPVRCTPIPEIDPENFKLREKPPEQTPDGWVQVWEIVELTEEEKLALQERNKEPTPISYGGDIDATGTEPDVIG